MEPYIAAWQGDLGGLKGWIEKKGEKKTSINKKCKVEKEDKAKYQHLNGKSLLYLACQKGYSEIVEYPLFFFFSSSSPSSFPPLLPLSLPFYFLLPILFCTLPLICFLHSHSRPPPTHVHSILTASHPFPLTHPTFLHTFSTVCMII